MSDLTSLQTIKTQLLARIAEITAAPKPSYKTATGQSVDWAGYMRELTKQLKEVNALLIAEDPTYVETQGVTPDEPFA